MDKNCNVDSVLAHALQAEEAFVQKHAYVLTARSTFLAFKPRLELEVSFARDPELYNFYHFIAVNPKRCPQVNYEAAMLYAPFLNSPEDQKPNSGFKIEGDRLFQPKVMDN